MHAYSHDLPLSPRVPDDHEDGTVKWVLELARPIDDEHGDPWLIQGVIFDITSRKEAEETAGRTERADERRSSRRSETSRPTELDVDAVMRSICERTAGAHPCGERVHPDAGWGRPRHARRDGVPRGQASVCGSRSKAPSRGGCTGTIARRSSIDAQDDERAGVIARELGLRSAVAVQLLHGDEAIGQLIVVSREPDAFTRDDRDTLESLSTALSSAIVHAGEFESKREQVDALARFETIYQGAAIGIALVSPDGAILDANPAFVRMFGYTTEELRAGVLDDAGQPAELNITDEAVPGHDGGNARQLRRGAAVRPQGRSVRCGAGSRLPCSATPRASRISPSP